MSNKDLCPICEEGNLTHLTDYHDVEYNGEVRSLPLHYSECDTCGSEQADAKDVRENKRAMQAFKKEVDGFLAGAEIIAIREQYGLTQKQAANIFGGGPVAFSKYEKDDVIQAESMDNLLYVCRESVDTMIRLAKRAGEFELVERLTMSQAEEMDTLSVSAPSNSDFYVDFDACEESDKTMVAYTGNVLPFTPREAA